MSCSSWSAPSCGRGSSKRPASCGPRQGPCYGRPCRSIWTGTRAGDSIHIVPLIKRCSMDAFEKNIRRMWREGKRAKGTQHVAIALSTLKRACGVKSKRRMTPREIIAAGKERTEWLSAPPSEILEAAMMVDRNPTRLRVEN